MKFQKIDNLYPREKYLKKIREFYHKSEIIKVLTGVRGCGKTSIINIIIKELLKSGVKKRNILYFNFDKIPYTKIKKTEELRSLILINNISRGLKYVFVDEVQYINGFERVINEFLQKKDFSIFIISSSNISSSDFLTYFAGRYVEFNIFPLSFDEYIEMKKYYGKIGVINKSDEFKKYISEGGFPYLLNPNDIIDKKKYVQNLISEIFNKDIKKRIFVREKLIFDFIFDYIIKNFGSTTTFKKMVADFRRNKSRIQLNHLSYILKL